VPSPAMQELVAGLWRWTAPHPEWRPRPRFGSDVACFALEQDDELALIDPLAPPEGSPEADEVWAALDRLAAPRRSIVVAITIPYHVRSTAAVRSRYAASHDVTVLGHPAAAKRLGRSVPVEPVEPDKPLPAGARAFPIGRPRRFEMPLLFPPNRALAFGDAVVGVEGELRVWENLKGERSRRWYGERFLPTLTPLLDLDFEHVLVAHGDPVVGDGHEQLERALSSEPCDYGH
jgi:hypothetical protein